jgi:hypothetical protein
VSVVIPLREVVLATRMFQQDSLPLHQDSLSQNSFIIQKVVTIHAEKLLPAGVAPMQRTSGLDTCDELNENVNVRRKITK